MSNSRVGKRRDARHKEAIYQHGFREGKAEAEARIAQLEAEKTRMLEALLAAEELHQNGILFTPNEKIERAHRLRQDILAARGTT